MKKILCILLTLFLLTGITACSQRGSGKSISYAIDKSPDTLDPQFAGETGALIIINNVFEGLVRLDAEGQIIPGIAKSWTVSDDGLVYDFILQESTEWYCPSSIKSKYGEDFYNKFCEEKVTANDFVFACRRTADPKINSPHADRLLVIEGAEEVISGKADVSTLGVTALSDTELQIRLSSPSEDFLARLTESEFMPCNEEFYEAMKGRYGLTSDNLLCNGPFYLSYWNEESQITIKRNKYYAGSQTVNPLSVAVTFDNDANSVNKKLTNGSLSATVLPPDAAVPENVEVIKEIPDTVIGFMFNCEDEFLQNANVRKAMCMSVDREIFASDSMTLTNGFIPGSCSLGTQSYRERVGEQTPEINHSTSGASELWKMGLEALETDKISITVLCPDRFDTQARQQLQIWQKSLGLSLAISVINMTDTEISLAVRNGNYQVALGYITTDESTASDFLKGFEDGGFFNYKDERFNSTLEYMKTAATDEELLGACFTAEDIILKQGLFFPIYSDGSKFVVSKDVQGITILDGEKTISFINARRFD